MPENTVKMLNGFMKDRYLRNFLVIHSVFRLDALSDGDFVETYMINKLSVTDEQAQKPFQKQIPAYIKDKLFIFNPEPIPFEVHPFRVEYGFRPDSGSENRYYDPIRITDVGIDVARRMDDIIKFLNTYDEIVL